jgi:hypothetical protein
MNMNALTPVPPKSLEAALAHVRNGGRLVVPTMTRVTVIDARCLARFEKVGVALLRESGDGYRMASGKSSVYLLPGQLRFEAP